MVPAGYWSSQRTRALWPSALEHLLPMKMNGIGWLAGEFSRLLSSAIPNGNCSGSTQSSRNSTRPLAITIAVGYAYGILRGNIEDPGSHFIYDAAALGMFLAMLGRPLSPLAKFRLRPLMPWFLFLTGWPVLLFFVPSQDALVQLVGLRGNIFFLPFLLAGAIAAGDDYTRIGKAISILK